MRVVLKGGTTRMTHAMIGTLLLRRRLFFPCSLLLTAFLPLPKALFGDPLR